MAIGFTNVHEVPYLGIITGRVFTHGHFSKFLFFQKSDVTIPDDDK